MHFWAINRETDRQTKNNTLPLGLAHKPRIQLGLKYSAEHKLLSVVVHKVRNLHETPHTTLPNPYVKMYMIEPINGGFGLCNKRLDKSKRKTKLLKNSVHPVFEETLDYFIPDLNSLKVIRLEISVCSDGGVLGRNTLLAHCIVSLSALHDAITIKKDEEKYRDALCTATGSTCQWYALTAPIIKTVTGDSMGAAVGAAATTVTTPNISKRYTRRSKSSPSAPLPPPLRSSTTNLPTAKEVRYNSKASL